MAADGHTRVLISKDGVHRALRRERLITRVATVGEHVARSELSKLDQALQLQLRYRDELDRSEGRLQERILTSKKSEVTGEISSPQLLSKESLFVLRCLCDCEELRQIRGRVNREVERIRSSRERCCAELKRQIKLRRRSASAHRWIGRAVKDAADNFEVTELEERRSFLQCSAML